MKKQALSLKVWIGIILCFVVFQYLSRLYFEEKIFYPRDSTSLSDGHFFRLEQDFRNTSSDILKVAVFGSSRVAKGIECPDKVRKILTDKGKPPIQLNKIWESFDPFEMFVKQKDFLKRIIPHQPDLICIQADMLAIQMAISEETKDMTVEKEHRRIWDLEYKGNKEKYLPKKIKYQSKVNQELVYSFLNGNLFSQGKEPCTIHDNYADIDTLKQSRRARSIKKTEDIQYTFDDLERLRKAGIKVVIMETPFPHEVEKVMRSQDFKKNLQGLKAEFKTKFDIDYWEYSGPILYYRYYADGGHLNQEGRIIYTEWLLDKIYKEIPID